jgi:hypothetical protein
MAMKGSCCVKRTDVERGGGLFSVNIEHVILVPSERCGTAEDESQEASATSTMQQSMYKMCMLYMLTRPYAGYSS